MPNVPDLESELQYSAARSGGKGGQNVNKVASKVELRFNLENSESLTEAQKRRIRKYLKNRITQEGEIVLTSESERSQLANRKKVTQRFYALLKKALIPRKPRLKTKPTRASKEKRLKSKKIHGQKKANRRNPGRDH